MKMAQTTLDCACMIFTYVDGKIEYGNQHSL